MKSSHECMYISNACLSSTDNTRNFFDLLSLPGYNYNAIVYLHGILRSEMLFIDYFTQTCIRHPLFIIISSHCMNNECKDESIMNLVVR